MLLYRLEKPVKPCGEEKRCFSVDRTTKVNIVISYKVGDKFPHYTLTGKLSTHFIMETRFLQLRF